MKETDQRDQLIIPTFFRDMVMIFFFLLIGLANKGTPPSRRDFKPEIAVCFGW
jgi:hypothetical protein